MSPHEDLPSHGTRQESNDIRCSLVDRESTTTISFTDFETVQEDRNELRRQLEIECWFAELVSAVLAWQEAMLRFAGRMRSEDTQRFVPLQVECELTHRMAAVLVTTHGLRPHIDKKHRNCPRQSACMIARAMRNSWTHANVRLLSVMTGGDNLYLTAPQIAHMPTGGHRHRIELRVPAEELLDRAKGKSRKILASAIAELFTDEKIDAVAVLNSHLRCINNAMMNYRAAVREPGEGRDELLGRHGLMDSPGVTASCGTQKMALGKPFRQMLDDRAQMRERNTEAPILELVQFGRGEFGTGSLEEARDSLLDLLDVRDLDSWSTETAADTLSLDGYAREELCNDAPALFRDAVTRLYERLTPA